MPTARQYSIPASFLSPTLVRQELGYVRWKYFPLRHRLAPGGQSISPAITSFIPCIRMSSTPIEIVKSIWGEINYIRRHEEANYTSPLIRKWQG